MIYRQGDVLLISIEAFPEKKKKKSLVLVEGEITGHCHQFNDPTIVSVFEANNEQYVEILGTAELFHEDHDNLFIDKGLYRVVQQREVDLLGEIQKVID